MVSAFGRTTDYWSPVQPGLMYEKGQGVEQDYVEAHKWFNISGINGNEIGRRNADIIEKKMTPGQIAVAVGLTRKWLEKL